MWKRLTVICLRAKSHRFGRLLAGGWIVIFTQAAEGYVRARPLGAAETAKAVARMQEAANVGNSTEPECVLLDPYCWLLHPLRRKKLSFVKRMCAMCHSPQHYWPDQPTHGWFCGVCDQKSLPARRCWSCVLKDPCPAVIRSEDQIRAKARPDL